MSFEQALALMKQGHKVKRADNKTDIYLIQNNIVYKYRYPNPNTSPIVFIHVFTFDDLFYNDWQLVE